jgi:hypothetical protein
MNRRRWALGRRRREPLYQALVADEVSTGRQRVWLVHEVETYLAGQCLLELCEQLLVVFDKLCTCMDVSSEDDQGRKERTLV